ncbi:hypothetical protein ACS0TY_009895 [Phlomoides rotata]
MELDLTPTPTKSVDDNEIETPTHTHTAAELKSHYRRHLPPPEFLAAYKECMKNHAATMGGHAVDGCGEYMPPPPDSASLTCAACGCHRNFHRREPAITPPFLDFRRPLQVKPTSSAEEHHQEPVTPTTENSVCRKRFRTKFRQDQKEKMHSFSEKLGWRIQKSDEAAVEEFGREVGVSRGVLKVWMHNNKNAFRKKESINGGDLISGNKIEEIRESDNGSHFHDSNNGSSNSSA